MPINVTEESSFDSDIIPSPYPNSITENLVSESQVAVQGLTNYQINNNALITLTKFGDGFIWSLVQKQTPSSASSITFSSLSGQKIYMIVYVLNFNAINNTNLYLQFNNDTTGTYHFSQPNGTVSNAQSNILLMNNSTTNIVQSAGEIEIIGLSSTFNNSSALVTIGTARGRTTAGEGTMSFEGGWGPVSQTAITDILLGTGAGNFTGTVWLF